MRQGLGILFIVLLAACSMGGADKAPEPIYGHPWTITTPPVVWYSGNPLVLTTCGTETGDGHYKGAVWMGLERCTVTFSQTKSLPIRAGDDVLRYYRNLPSLPEDLRAVGEPPRGWSGFYEVLVRDGANRDGGQ